MAVSGAVEGAVGGTIRPHPICRQSQRQSPSGSSPSFSWLSFHAASGGTVAVTAVNEQIGVVQLPPMPHLSGASAA